MLQPSSDRSQPEGPGPDDLTLLRALLDLDADPEIDSRVRSEQDDLLGSALARQQRFFAMSRSVVWRSRFWRLARVVNAMVLVWRGLRWTWPHMRPLRERSQRAGAQYAFLGLVLATLAWVVVGRPDQGGDRDPFVWFGAVGVIAGSLGLLRPVLASTRRLLKVLEVPRKQLWFGSLALLLALGVTLVLTTPAFRSWQVRHLAAVGEFDPGSLVGRALGLVLVVAVLAFVAVRLVQWARSRVIRWSERVLAIVMTVLAVLLCVLAVLGQAPHAQNVARGVISVMFWTFLLGTLLWAVVAVVEWALRYHGLRCRGVELERGWFRWWAAPAWLAAAFLFDPFVALIDRIAERQVSLSISHVISMLGLVSTMLVGLAILVTFWMGVVVIVRFVRRVNATHREAQRRAAFDGVAARWGDE
jgi:hypothetical protein